MRRKICAIGNSRGVSLPPEILERLHLSVGSEVEISLDEESYRIILEPALPADAPEGVDADFATQVSDFIEQYRPALKKLAK